MRIRIRNPDFTDPDHGGGGRESTYLWELHYPDPDDSGGSRESAYRPALGALVGSR
jgi:hypothetical protein